MTPAARPPRAQRSAEGHPGGTDRPAGRTSFARPEALHAGIYFPFRRTSVLLNTMSRFPTKAAHRPRTAGTPLRPSGLGGPTVHALQPAEIATLRDWLCDNRRPASPAEYRDTVACLLGLCGLRISEIKLLRRSDLKPTSRAVRVWTLKHGTPRDVPLPENVWFRLLVLDAWARARGTEWLFHTSTGNAVTARAIRRRWEKWCPTIIGRTARFHDLRHTAAMTVYANTHHDVVAVQRLLGHRSLRTTSDYLATQTDVRNLLPSCCPSPTPLPHPGASSAARCGFPPPSPPKCSPTPPTEPFPDSSLRGHARGGASTADSGAPTWPSEPPRSSTTPGPTPSTNSKSTRPPKHNPEPSSIG
uniref:Site-specific integrase n=1 Tax=Schlesneria paludicola TaxID=360056 RepID=A0A7C2JZ32_9PLAN